MSNQFEPRTFLRLHARDPDDDPSPGTARATNYVILQGHVALKGAHAGALLGPLATFIRYWGRPTTTQMLRGSVAFMGWTAAIATIAGVARVWSAEPYAIFDRAYRLNNNLSQNRVDRISLFSAGLGSALGSFFLPGIIPLRTRILGGFATGLAGGVLVHVISASIWAEDEEMTRRVQLERQAFKEKIMALKESKKGEEAKEKKA
ncbi:hypothetical protein DACRYDRAFT_101515 [Dacryopinax primogenitus]|uniref:Uncharacterized protein n=1 Tax=Dacryopinax primogenitus (strain DJM 731) TaxID=1858805 RepID=M5FZ60_DACPD|nr:uncharacterized protein DACRYDRAFT_101515 [Dacryopinax primogenitus]EJT98861.1 hypothetical protein DACRYDRAFT_101515 [Dacryopinax primogenitus]